MPSVSSSGRREAETGGVTRTSESVGEGIEKLDCRGRYIKKKKGCLETTMDEGFVEIEDKALFADMLRCDRGQERI